MKAGRVGYYKAEDGTFHLATVTSVHDGYLIALEPNKNEVKLMKGEFHKIHNHPLEIEMATACGVKLPTPPIKFISSGEDEDDDLDLDEPLDPED